MDTFPVHDVFLCVGIALFLPIAYSVIHFLWAGQRRLLPVPPGPTSLPLIGNAYQLFWRSPHEAFTLWARQYGGLVYLRFFYTGMLVVNSLRVAQDLMEAKSAVASDRPRFVLFSDLMGMENDMVLMPYGDKWRRYRRWVQDIIQNKHNVIDLPALQRRETLTLLAGLVQTPDAFTLHIKRWSAAFSMHISYGHDIKSLDDEHVRLIELALKATTDAGGPASTLVDLFPILKYIPTWMPGAGFKRRAIYVRHLRTKMQDAPFQTVKNALLSGNATPSLTSSLLEALWKEGDSAEYNEYDIKCVAAVLYAAGTESMSTTLTAFIQAMVLHPDVYTKTQQELDRIVGGSRLPNLTDRASLPYVENVLKELYRWSCAVPLGVPHRLMTDCTFHDYGLARGSTIIPNMWAMTRDETIFSDPERFLPERFMSYGVDGTKGEEQAIDPRGIVFGFGRRICPGRQFADSSLWLAVATIAAALNICKATGPDGATIIPVPAFPSGSIRHVADFQCVIRPRSQAIEGGLLSPAWMEEW